MKDEITLKFEELYKDSLVLSSLIFNGKEYVVNPFDKFVCVGETTQAGDSPPIVKIVYEAFKCGWSVRDEIDLTPWYDEYGVAWVSPPAEEYARLSKLIKTQEDRIVELEKAVHHWKSNHEYEVHRARLLKSRTDLDLNRISAYDKCSLTNYEKLENDLQRKNMEIAVLSGYMKTLQRHVKKLDPSWEQE